jgi:hypothetical protein
MAATKEPIVILAIVGFVTLSNLPENPELLNSGMNGARSEA